VPALGAGHAAELGGPKDDGVLQHAALLEILDQGGGAPGHPGRERTVVAPDVLVRVPVAAGKAAVVPAPDLDEAHAPLPEAARGEASAAEELGFRVFVDGGVVDTRAFGRKSVEVLDVLGFPG